MVRNNKITLNLNFHELQKQIFDTVANTDKYIICLAIGRQWGKSVLCKGSSIYYSLVKGKRVMWVSVSNRSAKFHWKDIVKAVEHLPNINISLSDRDIEFPSGGVLSIRSSVTSASLRGEPLDVIVCDEAAHYVDGGETFWEALYPSIVATKGKCVIPTTPNGRNWFYDLYNSGNNDKSEVISYSYPSVTSPIVDYDRVLLAKSFMSAIKWKQEFEAAFIGNQYSVFGNVLYLSDVEFMNKPIDGNTYVAGVDIGMGDNSTCITIIDVDNREQVYGYRIAEYESIKIVDEIVKVLDVWNPTATLLETNGIGQPVIQMLKNVLRGTVDDSELERVYSFKFSRAGKEHSIIGKHITNKIKTNMVECLVAELENKALSILSNDSEYGELQRMEMEHYESKLSPSESFRLYSAKAGQTDDTIAALYLATYLLPKIMVNRHLGKDFSNPFRVNYASS